VGKKGDNRKYLPSLQEALLDKTHLKDHLHETAEAMGISKETEPIWVKSR